MQHSNCRLADSIQSTLRLWGEGAGGAPVWSLTESDKFRTEDSVHKSFVEIWVQMGKKEIISD